MSQLEPLDEVEVPGAGTPALQRPSASCVHTCCSVCDVRRPAAWAQVVNTPIEQSESPQPQTSSEAPARMRKPQCGSAVVSTTTFGQRLVATQSCVRDPVSIPQPAPMIPESPAASLPPSAAVLADLLLPPPPCESCSIHSPR